MDLRKKLSKYEEKNRELDDILRVEEQNIAQQKARFSLDLTLDDDDPKIQRRRKDRS